MNTSGYTKEGMLVEYWQFTLFFIEFESVNGDGDDAISWKAYLDTDIEVDENGKPQAKSGAIYGGGITQYEAASDLFNEMDRKGTHHV